MQVVDDMSSSVETRRPLKRRRISRACDYCHQRSIRCRRVNDSPAGENCVNFAQPCTFSRIPKKRGVSSKAGEDPSGTVSAHKPSSSDAHLASRRASRHGPPRGIPRTGSLPTVRVEQAPLLRHDGTTNESDLPSIASQARIMDLVELYFEIVYPIFPFYHRPTFLRRTARAEYMADRAIYAETMAVCALVFGRVRDGAVSNPRWDTAELSQTQPQAFYDAAKEILRAEPVRADLAALRSHATLAICAIQLGFVRDMHFHIGQYHTLVAMTGFHDEAEWSRDIGIIEREERRRLFWSIYTLDIYTSIVWGGIARGREQQFNVSYSIEVDDVVITNTPQGSSTDMQESLENPADPNWLYGWNFTTDLYRILEHALAQFRERKAATGQRSSVLHDMFFRDRVETSIAVTSVRDKVMQLYLTLPDRFKQIPNDITFEPRKDLFGFQAANITATVQLLRMVLFSVEGGSVRLNDCCQIASEVISAFWSIPEAYQRAISAPLLHHLGGIGLILGGSALTFPEDSGFEEEEWICVRLRSVLQDLARLLSRLEG